MVFLQQPGGCGTMGKFNITKEISQDPLPHLGANLFDQEDGEVHIPKPTLRHAGQGTLWTDTVSVYNSWSPTVTVGIFKEIHWAGLGRSAFCRVWGLLCLVQGGRRSTEV